MLVASVSTVIDAAYLRLSPIRVGRVPTSLSTPDLYVTVAEGDTVVRVDAYAFGSQSFAFQDAVVWRDKLAIGFGSHVHAISLVDRSAISIDLGSYYADMYPTPDYLLIASGERLFRMEPDHSIMWKTAPLANDGVVVYEPGPTVIRGVAELGPPGRWEPFAVLASDGNATQRLEGE